MKVAMFTNTYLPHLGGVARAVNTLAEGCVRRGHEVRIIAPEFSGAEDLPGVLRVPAIQNFNGSDFSVQIPVPNLIGQFDQEFRPQLIHSHHPFLLGDAALREAWKLRVPIVFTHHTLYECYTHYVPLDSQALKRAVIQLASEYCNLCDLIVAPSESIASLLGKRGVRTPVKVIPTGIDTGFFAGGDGGRMRRKAGIGADAKVIGHLGRLVREKNLSYLAEAVAVCLNRDPAKVFLLAGDGDARHDVLELLARLTDARRVFAVGKQSGRDLADAYAAMDAFAFASQSETQGLVLAEAMAAGTPVVALDGPGVRDIVRDDVNGLLLHHSAPARDFAAALEAVLDGSEVAARLAAGARLTAADYHVDCCVRRVVDCYDELIRDHPRRGETDPLPWQRLLAAIEIEWSLLVEKMSAAAAAVKESPQVEEAALD